MGFTCQIQRKKGESGTSPGNSIKGLFDSRGDSQPFYIIHDWTLLDHDYYRSERTVPKLELRHPCLSTEIFKAGA